MVLEQLDAYKQKKKRKKEKENKNKPRSKSHTLHKNLLKMNCKLHTKNTKISWTWWRMHVITATWEAQAGESLEPRRQRLW